MNGETQKLIYDLQYLGQFKTQSTQQGEQERERRDQGNLCISSVTENITYLLLATIGMFGGALNHGLPYYLLR